jgi:hypothetical protein
VSELCGVKPYVLRYWEQEFTQLKPMKRRGNRRYYQHHEVLLIRRIRELCTSRASPSAAPATALPMPARAGPTRSPRRPPWLPSRREAALPPRHDRRVTDGATVAEVDAESPLAPLFTLSAAQVRQELISIRGLLAP